MMMSEFIERTGFEPMAEEYSWIESKYYEFSGDKDAFCKDFVKNGGIDKLIRQRADTITAVKQQLKEMECSLEDIQKAHKKDIEELRAALDAELEWRPSGCGTEMEQEKYEELSFSAGTRILTEQDAKDLIYKEFGFAPEKIQIINTVHTYEVNKHYQIRPAEKYDRKPVYNASDWNYIRFNCAGLKYEMVNGALSHYES